MVVFADVMKRSRWREMDVKAMVSFCFFASSFWELFNGVDNNPEQQTSQTESVIHMPKNLARINALYLVDPTRIFYSTIMVRNCVLEKRRMRTLNTKRTVPHFRTLAYVLTKYPEHLISIKTRKWAQYVWTWRQSVVPNDAPRDFGPEVAFGAKFQIPVARQGGREMSAPRPYETDPFHPLGSTLNKNHFLYI